MADQKTKNDLLTKLQGNIKDLVEASLDTIDSTEEDFIQVEFERTITGEKYKATIEKIR